MLLDRPVVLLAGKGGVGKTTTAAALALRAADDGHATLLISTDPAHNLGDLFGRAARDGAIRRVDAGLDVLEIDPDAETRRYLATVKDNIRRLVSSTMLEEAERQIDLAGRVPGAAESALLERIVAILLDERADYARVVFDTAPTGHTVRLLTLPELMGAWVDGLLRRRGERSRERARWLGSGEVPDDPVFELLHRRRRRLAEARALLRDPATSEIAFVLNPDALSIAETRRGIDELADHGLAVASVIVNRLLPDDLGEAFMRERLALQRRCLARIEHEFAGFARGFLPLLAGDADSRDALRTLAAALRAPGTR